MSAKANQKNKSRKSKEVLRILEGSAQSRFIDALAGRSATDLADVEPAVRRIVTDVRRNGDRALRRYATRLDGLQKDQPLRVPEDELHQAWEKTNPELQDAIEQAAGNIRRYAEWQASPALDEWRRELQPGVTVGQLVRPLDSVGCYVPGGRYPLPSTLLMTVIPAQVVGVKQIRVASPRPAQATLAAAAFLGVHEFYRVGGAQAIAALAYGTNEIPRVDKIVGPGNRYVTAAKKLVAFRLRHRIPRRPDRSRHHQRKRRRGLHRDRTSWLRPNMIPTRSAFSSHPLACLRRRFRKTCDNELVTIRSPCNLSRAAARFCSSIP